MIPFEKEVGKNQRMNELLCLLELHLLRFSPINSYTIDLADRQQSINEV